MTASPKDSAQSFFDSITANEALQSSKLPPVDQWNPELNGDLDMRIDRDGRWFYLGDEIRRPAMVKMFSSILKREGDDYFLVTPVEKWRIRVDQAPFSIISASREEDEQRGVFYVLTTNVDTQVILSDEHPLWPATSSASEEPAPLVRVRGQLNGLVNRNVFYQLVDACELLEVDGREGLYLTSSGQRFCLGYTA